MHTTHVHIFIYNTHRSEAVLLMALCNYFKKGGPVLPTLRTCGEQANTEALRESSGEPTGKKAVTPSLETSTIATRIKGTGREVRP